MITKYEEYRIRVWFPSGAKIILLFTVPTPSLGSSGWDMMCEASPLYEFKNMWTCTPVPQYMFMVWCIIRHTDNLGGASPYQVQNVWFIVERSTSQMTYAGYPTIQTILCLNQQWRTWWRSWLRHCATSRKVAGSIPNGVTGIFHWHNPSGHTMALGLTQPPKEMSIRNISWGVKEASA
jgi:hypothetical protein